VAVGAVVAVLFVSGVLDPGSDRPVGGGSSTGTRNPTGTRASDVPEEVVPGVTIGTPENPYTGGESFTVMEDWTFTVGASDTDAWPDIAAEWDDRPDVDQYQPHPGTVFVMAPASMTYTGPPSDQGRVKGFFVSYVAPDGALIHPHCGRYGTTFDQFDNSTASDEPSEDASFCAQVLPEQVAGGLWQVSMFTYDDDLTERRVEVYYAVS